MSEDAVARLALMSCIEGGSPFWSKEVRDYGAPYVFEKAKDGFYTGRKNSDDKITEHIRIINTDSLIS